MIVLEDEPEQFVICCLSDQTVLKDTDGCTHCGGGRSDSSEGHRRLRTLRRRKVFRCCILVLMWNATKRWRCGRFGKWSQPWTPAEVLLHTLRVLAVTCWAHDAVRDRDLFARCTNHRFVVFFICTVSTVRRGKADVCSLTVCICVCLDWLIDWVRFNVPPNTL